MVCAIVRIVVLEEVAAEVRSGPVLLSAGSFVGLAGHSGTGDAGIFQNPDGSYVLRFEAFDIEDGPDLAVYVVPVRRVRRRVRRRHLTIG